MDNSDTHNNILKVIADNQAASMSAYQKSIEASQKQAVECLRAQQLAEEVLREEIKRKDTYEKMIVALSTFIETSREVFLVESSRAEQARVNYELLKLILEVQRLIANRLLRIQPVENADEKQIVDRLFEIIEKNKNSEGKRERIELTTNVNSGRDSNVKIKGEHND